MKHKMFAVHDAKALAFLPPFCLHTEDMARRAFMDCIADPNHAFGRHPQDYTLFQVGQFDDDTGHVFQDKQSLGNGVEFVRYAANKQTADLFGNAVDTVDNANPIAKTATR